MGATTLTAAGTQAGGGSTEVSKSSTRAVQSRREGIRRIFESGRQGPNARMLPKAALATDVSHLEGQISSSTSQFNHKDPSAFQRSDVVRSARARSTMRAQNFGRSRTPMNQTADTLALRPAPIELASSTYHPFQQVNLRTATPSRLGSSRPSTMHASDF